jgi:hypothetical protein
VFCVAKGGKRSKELTERELAEGVDLLDTVEEWKKRIKREVIVK